MQKLEDLERARTTQELRFSDKYERLKINANTKIRKLREELQLN